MALSLEHQVHRQLLGAQISEDSRHTVKSWLGHSEAATCTPADPSAKEAASKEAAAELQPFFPTSSELVNAMPLWDSEMDGKIWVSDFDMILYLSYGVPTPVQGFTGEDERQEADFKDEPSKLAMWQELKDECTTFDSLFDIHRARAILLRRRKFVAETSRLVSEGRMKMMTSRSSNRATVSLGDYMRAFMRLDIDGNGVICARDLKEAMGAFVGGRMSLEMSKEIIRKVDRDYNGVVDLIELWELLKIL